MNNERKHAHQFLKKKKKSSKQEKKNATTGDYTLYSNLIPQKLHMAGLLKYIFFTSYIFSCFSILERFASLFPNYQFLRM